MKLDLLFRQCIEHNASDLHLSSGMPVLYRIDGDLVRMSEEVLCKDQLQAALMDIMQSDQQTHFQEELACDFSFEVPGLSRFRANVYEQSRGIAAAFRCIPAQIPSLVSIQAPAILSKLLSHPRGLILVTGSTGSGKSTTLAAMVDHLNQNTAKHLLTLEDPIEFVHHPKQCLVHQREIGAQASSFEAALRSAMREDPDVILVGELRDLETIRLAISAAETGHLVLATLHTSGAAKCIDRIVDVFPAEEKNMVRNMLSESLTAVISQVLLKRKEGKGRIAAHEIMVATPSIRHLVREGKVAQMVSAMQTGQAAGMQTLDQSLSALVKNGLVELSQARIQASFPEHMGELA